MSKRKFTDSIKGKGYYIALILCAVAIGISGYLYYQNAHETVQTGGTDESVAATYDDHVSVVGTQPNLGTQPGQEDPTGPSATQPSVVRKPLQTVAPVEGEIVAAYAMDSLSYNVTTRDWRVHNGVDYAAEAGSQVCAAADGTVYTVYEDETMGMTVVIRHADGYVTVYSSLGEDVTVAAGDTVSAGQVIGCVGSSALLESAIGDHLHFSVTWNDEPVDPAKFLAGE